jgi:radical SAM protein with 4Fe4S-binding SPASM domain
MSDYKYNSTNLVKPVDLTDREQFLLTESKTFCIYPWIHLHAYPTGEAYPCCHAEMKYPVGNCRSNTLKEIWQDRPRLLNDFKQFYTQYDQRRGKCFDLAFPALTPWYDSL